jgi:predicted transcriptional regulator
MNYNNKGRHNNHIDSPSFKEYAYRVLKNITPFQKETLTEREKYHFQTDYLLQKFCKEERIDHILYILGKCGIEWTIRVSKDDLLFEADMAEFATQDCLESPQRQIEVIEATKRAVVCVISSRDIMFNSHVMAQNCTTKIYKISEFSQSLIKLHRDFGQLEGWDKQVEGSEKAHNWFNEVILEVENAMDYAVNGLDLGREDVRVLCALYKKKHKAVTMTELAEITRSVGKKMYFRKSMSGLLKSGLVASDNKNPKKAWAEKTYFMITTKGIDVIMRYREQVLKNVLAA